MAIKWHTQIRDIHLDPTTGPNGDVPLCVPNAAATLESSYTAAGQIYYDETNTRLRAYINGAWTTIGAAGAASDADSIYNGGAWTVTVDANDIRWNLSTGFNDIFYAAAAGTTACAIEINDNTSGTFTDGILFTAANSIVDAIDASAAAITNAINIGANAIAGTNFSVTGAGVITSAGHTDSGTSALTTLTAPILTMAFSGAYTGGAVILDMTNAVGAIGLTLTGAGTRTVSMVSITDTPSTTATFDLNVTPAGAQAGANVFDIDIAGTGSANVVTIDFAAAYTGDAFSINMTNAVAASAFDITGAGTRTVPLITITDVPTTSAPSIDLNITPAASVQAGIY